MTSKRDGRPIELKGLAARRSREVASLLSDLEGKPHAQRATGRRTLWTQAFLASGKGGKFGPAPRVLADREGSER